MCRCIPASALRVVLLLEVVRVVLRRLRGLTAVDGVWGRRRRSAVSGQRARERRGGSAVRRQRARARERECRAQDEGGWARDRIEGRGGAARWGWCGWLVDSATAGADRGARGGRFDTHGGTGVVGTAIELDSTSFSGHSKLKTTTHLASRFPPMLRRLSPLDLDAIAAVGGGVHGPG
jgi:hypothetical protein